MMNLPKGGGKLPPPPFFLIKNFHQLKKLKKDMDIKKLQLKL